MSRIVEESEKLIEDLVKAYLKYLKKQKIKIPYTEDQLYHLGRTLALVCVSRNVRKYKIRRRKVEAFGYSWQLEELSKREKQIQNQLRQLCAHSPSKNPKDF